jgi:hypothetical protein
MQRPLVYCWTGEAMQPLARFARDADKRFVIGQRYTLDEIQERSSRSHAHYFASVGNAWSNLPDHIAAQFPTAEHLRKHALIRTGFRDERSIACSSKAEALRLAAFIKPMDEYAIVTVSGPLVSVYTAKSQSCRAMGKQDFQRSKDAVLAFLDELLGIGRGETEKQGEAA